MADDRKATEPTEADDGSGAPNPGRAPGADAPGPDPIPSTDDPRQPTHRMMPPDTGQGRKMMIYAVAAVALVIVLLLVFG